MSESVNPISDLVERLRLAIAARPKFKALPIDIEDVHAIVAALNVSAVDGARMDHLEALLAEAGTTPARVTNAGASGLGLASSYYLQAGGKLGVPLRNVVDADRERLATLAAHRAKARR